LNDFVDVMGSSTTGRLPEEKASPAAVRAFPICTTCFRHF
jgi:hypothetical protein